VADVTARTQAHHRPMEGPFVAGSDGSDTAADAVRLATRLAAAVGTRVVVADAFLPGRDVAQGLREIARRERASLLAVGRTQRGPAGRGLADSVPDQLLAHAPCPVLVVPPGRRGALGVIGVAFDAREASLAALTFAKDLAHDVGARVVLLGVGSIQHGLSFDPLAYCDIECRTLHGPPSSALEAECSDGIDLLVAGSRGYGPLHSVVAGSVSRHLAHHAPCPVLVVPRGARDRLRVARPTVSAA
jgi:nucleotide-binding universal stress UspA family protein